MFAIANRLQGHYKAQQLRALFYGPNVVQQHLLSVLPRKSSKAFMVTTNSLLTTPLMTFLENLLTMKHHAGTFSGTKEHAPQAQIDRAIRHVARDPDIDTIISVGGGSSIDSAKVISYRTHQATAKWLSHITIPTTLSAAECTDFAGYTRVRWHQN